MHAAVPSSLCEHGIGVIELNHFTDRSGDFARRVYLGFLKGFTATESINQEDRLVLDVLATELHHARHLRGVVPSVQPIAIH